MDPSFPNPAYSRLGKTLQRFVPKMGSVTYYVYRAGFEFFRAGLVRPGWRRRMLSAVCRAHLRTVRDSRLRQALTPDHQPMCRRLIISGRFYRAIQRPDVELVTTGIDHVTTEGIVTTDGRLHEVDVIALATGFDAHAFIRPTALIGEDGVTLDEVWRDGPRAHLTASLPGFPNFSCCWPAQARLETTRSPLSPKRRRLYPKLDPAMAPTGVRHRGATSAATDRFNAEMQVAMPDTVWATGCTSWYIGQDGNPELWPWNPSQLRVRLGQIDLVTIICDFTPQASLSGFRPG